MVILGFEWNKIGIQESLMELIVMTEPGFVIE